jgi:hypothetical protein
VILVGAHATTGLTRNQAETQSGFRVSKQARPWYFAIVRKLIALKFISYPERLEITSGSPRHSCTSDACIDAPRVENERTWSEIDEAR